MAMGRRKPKQPGLWISSEEMPRTAAHPYYGKVNEVLNEAGFDRKVEHLCRRYYKPTVSSFAVQRWRIELLLFQTSGTAFAIGGATAMPCFHK